MKRKARRSKFHRPGKGVFRIVEFRNPSGEIAFRVTGWTLEGERIRENFKEHGEAVTRKQELDVQAANLETAGQTVFTRLSAAEVNDAESALSSLRAGGHSSLREAAEFFIRNWRDPLNRILTGEAVEKFLAEKTASNRRARHLRSLRHDLHCLSALYGRKPVHEITKDDLLGMVQAGNRAPRTQNHVRDRLHNFLGWCKRNGYAPENRAALIEKKSVDAGEIAVLSNAEVRALMEAAAEFKGGKLVPYVALATFCAIRPDEVVRLSWVQIDLAEKQVTITASAAKKRGRRVVDMPENCVAWLRPHVARGTPIVGPNWRKEFAELREKVGFGNPATEDATEEEKKRRVGLRPWPQDVLRHTGISCHYRKHGDEAKTAAWAGNSPDMIHTHYRALVSAKDAEALFEIRPKAKRGRRGGKIVVLETEMVAAAPVATTG